MSIFVRFCVLLFFVFFGSSAFSAEVTLKLHHFMPPHSNVPRLILDVWSSNIERASDGRISVRSFPSMQLGGTPPELIDQAIDGVVDVVWTVVGYTPGRFPRTEVFELPFMMTDSGSVSRAYWRMFERHMRDTEFRDVHILGTWVHGPGLIHSRRPVRSVSDLSGLKVRGGSRMVNRLLSRLGATPVGMPVPSVPESLSRGVIDATTIPWGVTSSLKIPELVSYHTEFSGESLYTLTFVLAMNKSVYEGLPADLRRIIDDNSGEEFSVFAGVTQAGLDGPSRDLAVSRGNEIIVLSGSDIDSWRSASDLVYSDWVSEMSDLGIDGQALIDEARSLISDFSR